MPGTKQGVEKRLATVARIYGKDAHAKWGAAGGKAKVLKGMAWIKVNQPERFDEIMRNRKKRY